MNVYDFDDTIYRGDTSIDLIKYTLIKHPFLMLKYIFKFIKKGVLYKLNKVEFKEVKETLFMFLIEIKDLDKYLEKFTDKYMKNIKSWYKEKQKKEDLVISASYTIWIKKFCDRLNIKNVIGTEVDLKTGKIIGNNCSGEEKLKRFDKLFPNIEILESYSDSKKDIPLLERAKQGYVVKGDKITPYKKEYKF